MSFVILDGVGYETESKRLFNNMASAPDSGRKRIINNLIKRLKEDGGGTVLERLWIMAAHNQQASRINWKSPGTYTLTEVNSPTWTINQGYTGNASNMYLNTNFIPSTNAVQATLNNTNLFIYSRTDQAASIKSEMGGLDATDGDFCQIRSSGNVMRGRVNSATPSVQTVSTISNSLGLFSYIRQDSSNQLFHQNGVALGGGIAKTSTAMGTVALYLLGFNNNGTAASLTDKQLAIAGFGSGSINTLLLFNAIEAYMDAIGTGVV